MTGASGWNPLRPDSPIAEGVLGWSDGLVVRLAEAAYVHRSLPSGRLDIGSSYSPMPSRTPAAPTTGSWGTFGCRAARQGRVGLDVVRGKA
jgi:hypothetical protein